MRLPRFLLPAHRRACLANLDLAISSLPAPLRQRPRPEPAAPAGSPSAPVRVLEFEADVATNP